ncbi:MAG: glycerol-3-phosphate dehydrogenase/oxidase [Phototrophicaceae bacterium]
MTRQNKLKNIQDNPDVDVLIIGGGINGIGTFRDLALQGIRVVLAEKDDYCSGASAGSSHMLHGGIRYLENAEFRLVQEALHERNRMFRNAPHYAKPLPTTIPMFRWFSGMLNAPLKFAGIMDKPSERGAAVIKIGLTMYDWYTRDDDMTPSHDFKMKQASLETYPKLNQAIVCTATYYDGWMPYPERICMDLLRDASNANEDAIAFNYLRAGDGDKDSVTLIDELTGDSYDIKPKVVINAAGPWIDFVNRAMGQQTNFIGGTKGSHLMLDHPELHEACGGTEFFFENSDGRIVLIFPFHNRVMVGTTDIRIENPEEAVCTDEEIDYILGMIPKVFPTIEVNRSHIVYTFSGVRPLPSSESSSTGTISRDHSIRTVEKGKSDYDFPIHSLIGGKWTSWRAFSEESAKTALKDINQTRKIDTKYLSIGGGLNYPIDEQGRDIWLDNLQQKTELSREQLDILFERYGTYAETVAEFVSAENDSDLAHVPNYTQREVSYIAQSEAVEHVDDFLQRRSALAILGYANPDAISELANIIGKALDWDSEKISQEIERTNSILTQKHRMGDIQAV